MTPGPQLPAGPEACEGPTTLPEGGRDLGQEAVQGPPRQGTAGLPAPVALPLLLEPERVQAGAGVRTVGHAGCRGSAVLRNEEGPHCPLGPGTMSFLLCQPSPAQAAEHLKLRQGELGNPQSSRTSEGGSTPQPSEAPAISRAPSLPRRVWPKGQEHQHSWQKPQKPTHAAGMLGQRAEARGSGGQAHRWQWAQSVWNRGRSPCCQHGGIRVRAAETRPRETVKIAGSAYLEHARHRGE